MLFGLEPNTSGDEHAEHFFLHELSWISPSLRFGDDATGRLGQILIETLAATLPVHMGWSLSSYLNIGAKPEDGE